MENQEKPKLIDSIRESLRLARAQEAKLIGELEEFQASIVSPLESVLENLEAQENGKEMAAPITPSPKDSLEATVAILRSNGNGMRKKDIAKQAYAKGTILSSKGAEGVEAIVSNTLTRHSPRVFVNIGWGWWDLAERHKKQERSAPSSPTNQTEPIRFPRLASNS